MFRSVTALLLATALLSRSAVAADAPLPPPDIRIESGQRVSMPEDTFKVYLNLQLQTELCQAKLGVRDDLMKQMAVQVERSWWERHGFWVGLTLGFVGAIGLTWGTVKVLSTAAK